MRYLILFISFFSVAFGQVEFSTTQHDFGSLESRSQRYVDIELKNVGNKKAYILSIHHERIVSYRYEKKLIEPGESVLLRLQINQDKKGKFKEDILVYTSTRMEPTKITLRGEVLEKAYDSSPECPSFENSPSNEEKAQFDFRILVIDDSTEQAIHKAEVSIVANGRIAYQWKTDKKGQINEDFPLGYYYFVSKAEGYLNEEFDAFVNRRNNELIIRMKRIKTPPKKPEILLVVKAEASDTLDLVEEEAKDSSTFKEITLVPVNPTAPLEVEETDEIRDTLTFENAAFNSENFKANNIVFVLDISGSMRKEGRLDLLKSSMIEMIEMLRPEDKVSIISFANGSDPILEATYATAANKEIMIQKVQALSAGGSTNGEAGIKRGYQLANENRIENGNNRVIIVTDGAFNQGSNVFIKTARQEAKKEIYMSALAVKAGSYSKSMLAGLVKYSNGRILDVQDFESAINALVLEIRLGSYRYE